jgi:RNA polymerase sigma factor (sigma-70 family)
VNDQTNSQLLRAYAEKRSEAAFSELVRRHLDLVYSAALRMVCDRHLAEDVTQGVFLAFAKSAGQLADRPVISGWLHRTAQNIAAQTVRTIERRRAREQEAVAMTEMFAAEPDASWDHIAPHLDAALGELDEADRDAVMLRYFERKSALEMAQIFGVSDAAAQKRVSRAVERLREFFAKRGVKVGASGLVVVVSANAVQAAPVGLALTISTATAAIAGTTLATTVIATHTTMNWLNLKAVAAIAAAALTAGTGSYLVTQRDANRQRNENRILLDQQQKLAGERDAALSAVAARQIELDRLRSNQNELLQLRSEVGTFRRMTNDLARVREENSQLRSRLATSPSQPAAATPGAAENHFPKSAWAFAGYASPEDAVKTWVWAMDKGDKKAMLASLVPEEIGTWSRILDGAGESDLAHKSPFSAFSLVDRKVISDTEVVLTVVSDFADGSSTDKAKMKIRKIGTEWKIAGPAE